MFNSAGNRVITTGISADIGLRQEMEDEHAIYERPEVGFFSAEVYDGHNGKGAAQAAAEMLTPHFLSAWIEESHTPANERQPEEEILRQAYLSVDKYITTRHIESGTAAATFYIMGDRFIAANTGDSRIVIGVDSGAAPLTLDHKPDLPIERERIEALGGRVTSFGVPRVMGLLAMSRALGDTSLKPFVTSEPRIMTGLLGTENDYAVIACDGVWDVLTPETVIRITREERDAQKGADSIKTEALAQGTTDNISVIVLDLRTYTRALSRKHMEVLGIFDKATE
jgi:serine/threonine protein phosphatase PrpC